MAIGYAEIADEVLAGRPGPDRRELVAISDRLLEDLEQLNLGAPDGGSRPVAISARLADAVNQLLVECDLPVRRLWNTSGALDAVYDAQEILFGTAENEAGSEPDAARS